MASEGSEVSSANRHPVVQNKNSDIILKQGMNYESWRIKLLTKISSKGAKPVTMENPMELQYRSASTFHQMTIFPQYDIMQDTAKNVLFKRLSQQDMDKVQHLPSFLAMMEVLDGRYGIRTHVGAVAARTRLNRLFYQGNKDFHKFLSLFEIRLEEAIQAGNHFEEYDKMFQLTQALGPMYMDTLNAMNSEPVLRQNFTTFLLKVRERHEMMELFAEKPDNSSRRNNNDSQSHGQGPRCYNCNDFGHKGHSCPKKEKESESPTVGKPPTDVKTEEKKLDWMKFVNTRPN